MGGFLRLIRDFSSQLHFLAGNAIIALDCAAARHMLTKHLLSVYVGNRRKKSLRAWPCHAIPRAKGVPYAPAFSSRAEPLVGSQPGTFHVEQRQRTPSVVRNTRRVLDTC